MKSGEWAAHAKHDGGIMISERGCRSARTHTYTKEPRQTEKHVRVMSVSVVVQQGAVRRRAAVTTVRLAFTLKDPLTQNRQFALKKLFPTPLRPFCVPKSFASKISA